MGSMSILEGNEFALGIKGFGQDFPEAPSVYDPAGLNPDEGAYPGSSGKIEGYGGIGRDGEVDAAKWRAFLSEMRPALMALGSLFKRHDTAATAFSFDNPIHALLAIESEVVGKEDVERAYQIVQDILNRVRKQLSKAKRTPQQKVELVYHVMLGVGIEFGAQEDVLFTRNINAMKLDCDTSSFVVLAVAHELGWPLRLVMAPQHVFVRWDDGKGTRFNTDYSAPWLHDSDDYYVRKHKISAKSVGQGVYLKDLDFRETLALFYGNRAAAKDRREDAIRDHDITIALDPQYAEVRNDRGATNAFLGNLKDARADFQAARDLVPKMKRARINLFLVNLIPDPLHFGIQPRVGVDAFDGRFAVGATWPVVEISETSRLGPRLEVGYATDGGHHLLDLSAELALTCRSEGSSVTANAGVGYSLALAGDVAGAPLRNGAFFQYGLHYSHAFADFFGLGVSFVLQHEMADPARFAILPGLEFTYSPWRW